MFSPLDSKEKMRIINIFIVLSLLLSAQLSYATCNSFECASKGGACVNGACVVPTPTPKPTPTPTQVPVPTSSTIVTIQQLYCDNRICIIIVSPPSYLGQLSVPSK